LDKDKALEAAVTQIERQFGKGSVMRLGDHPVSDDMQFVPTGSLALDIALGVGGIPRGRIIEIYGPESSGKTTMVYHLIAQAQRLGGTAAFIDAEHAMDPIYGEQALEITEMLVRSGALDVVAIDSVAALTPKAEIEGEMGDSFVGLQARLMSQALRKLAGTLNRSGTICCFTNQLREKIGVMFGNPEVTTGGKALKFYATIRLDIRRIETLKDGTEAIGNRVRVKVAKNKVAPPFKLAEFDIMYGQGISREGTLLDLGVTYDVVAKSGAFFSYHDDRLGQGRANARTFLKDNPDMADAIELQIREKAGLPLADVGGTAPAAPLPAPAGVDPVTGEVL
jgi:recombination protein RecA